MDEKESLCEHANAASVTTAITALAGVISRWPKRRCFACLGCGRQLVSVEGLWNHAQQNGMEHGLALWMARGGEACLCCAECGFLEGGWANNAIRGGRRASFAPGEMFDAREGEMPQWEPSIEEMESWPAEAKEGAVAIPPGLANMGSTCFLSSVLQCLFALSPIRAYFFGGGHQKASCRWKQGNCLACEMDELLQMWNIGDKPLAPGNLLYAWWSRIHAERLHQQKDAHELFLSLCKCVHEDTTGGAPPPSPRAISRCKCPVHATFGGWMRNYFRCTQCTGSYSTTEPFLCLSLALPWRNGGGSSSQATPLTSLLHRWATPERLTSSRCQHCGATREKSQCLTLVPPVLALHLSRFAIGGKWSPEKVQTEVACPTKCLDVREVTASGLAGVSSRLPYDLVGAVYHSGSIEGGHYVAYVRLGDATWAKCDDHKVERIGEDGARAAAKSAYLLFYADRRLLDKDAGAEEPLQDADIAYSEFLSLIKEAMADR